MDPARWSLGGAHDVSVGHVGEEHARGYELLAHVRQLCPVQVHVSITVLQSRHPEDPPK